MLAVYNCHMTTGALVHRFAKQWLAVARVQFGLDADYGNDGGWWERNHWLRVEGPLSSVKRFAVMFERWAKELDDVNRSP